MAVIGFLVLLFTAWMLYGWCLGESTDVRWLRLCCAPIFVVMVALISGGGGAGLALVTTKKAVRTDMAALLKVVEMRIQAGDAERLLEELKGLDHGNDPDADAFDLLEQIPQLTCRLLDAAPAAADPPQEASDIRKTGVVRRLSQAVELR